MTRDLIVSRFCGTTWAALREDGLPVELHVESENRGAGFGRIALGRVTNVVPGLRAAFVDIGDRRDALLRAADLRLPGDAAGSPPPEMPIEDRLRRGRELLVQVAREPTGRKGARVSCRLSLAGRWLVLFDGNAEAAVSHRIRDTGERRRLLQILSRWTTAEGAFVARTAASGADENLLQREAEALLEERRSIRDAAASGGAPRVIRTEPDLLGRLLRDGATGKLQGIGVDDAEDRRRALGYLDGISGEPREIVRLHPGPDSLFEAEGLGRELSRCLEPRVRLPSGGELVIEPTEALLSVDVNSAGHMRGGSMEQTARETNIEAAREIAKQIRLRDVSGIIVVDFIDMETDESRERVLEALRNSLAGDRRRSRLYGFTDLGLLQMTRQHGRSGLSELLGGECSACGRGGRSRSTLLTVAGTVAELRQREREAAPGEHVVRADAELALALRRALAAEEAAGRALGARLHIEQADDATPVPPRPGQS